ncbi:histidine kinase, partial [Bacteroidales bacterium OttesenSCG-928-B11]|nr:histidine kinase [Bacteroidales bacterium OttesenSCG-928-B11]
LGLTIIFSFIITRIQMIIFDVPQMDFRKPMKGHFVRDLFLMIIVVFTSQILYLSQKRQQIASKYEALQAENMKIRYEALKNQIDPHFFFNTLSSLYFLIETDTQKAQDYTHKISSVYRYTLQNKESVTLRNEIEFTKDYASLVQIRYGEQLSIIFNIDEKYLDYEIVPLSIQTLVENAIKHNIISNKQPLTVTIQTTSDNMITVSNNLQTKEISEPGEGIGLSNLAERYRLRWQKNIIIKNNGETFSVTVPLHQNATM